MRTRTIPPLARATWVTGRAFASVGRLLTLSALALPVWWLMRPQQPTEVPPPPAQPEIPRLLPETPLLEDLPRQASPEIASPATPTPAREVTQPPEQLVIPSIDLDAPITPVGWVAVEVQGQTVGQWQVSDAEMVGWHNTSAGLGQVGNTVLNGHHNLHGEVFGRLVELKVGDEVWLSAGENQRVYMVTEIVTLLEKGQPIEVRLANAERILPTDDERVTLVTCWPYSGNSHRLVVVAKPMPRHPLSSFSQ